MATITNESNLIIIEDNTGRYKYPKGIISYKVNDSTENITIYNIYTKKPLHVFDRTVITNPSNSSLAELETGLDSFFGGILDYALDVSAGNISNQEAIFILGENPDVDSAAEEDIWGQGGTKVWLTSAETMDLVSTSANDTALGTGARVIQVTGVDGSFNEVVELVPLNGVTPVTTTNSFLAINKMIAVTSGSTLSNEGIIRATQSTSLNIEDYIGIGLSISMSAHYVVPLGKSMYMNRAELNSVRDAAQSPIIEFKGQIRQNVNSNADASWIQIYDKLLDTATMNSLDVEPTVYFKLEETSYFRAVANTDENNTDFRVRLYAVQVTE